MCSSERCRAVLSLNLLVAHLQDGHTETLPPTDGNRLCRRTGCAVPLHDAAATFCGRRQHGHSILLLVHGSKHIYCFHWAPVSFTNATQIPNNALGRGGNSGLC